MTKRYQLTVGVRFSWWLKPMLYLACLAALFGFRDIEIGGLINRGTHVYVV